MCQVDGCPNCVLNVESPLCEVPVENGVRCAYMCTDCGHYWTTDWTADLAQPLAKPVVTEESFTPLCDVESEARKRPRGAVTPGAWPTNKESTLSIVTPAPTSVYLYYDRDEILIYVGITSRGGKRQSEHNRDKDWWSYVARQEVEHYDSRTKALTRERGLILAHTPPFNKQQNPVHEQVHTAYMMFRASHDSAVDLRDALRLMQQRIELDVHHQIAGDAIVLRTRVSDAALTAAMRMPESPARVFGIGKNNCRVERVDRAGPLAMIRLTSTSGHPIDSAYASVKFDQKQRLVLRNVHIALDHSDPSRCLRRCANRKDNQTPREIRWVRPDGEGRASD